ncbi:serine hydrolase domain-containing protein [Fibrella aquatilis]|uniref:Beta-lactamase family protein n=1 Tax=Fibrella aquatilis TaxID=2817059 RepID=A0A939G3N2_9BACT|nr:serine hydrolase domain-containing protein [Fibrella aquatilis]MBO0931474.1 beta-lactamase family protein [Fibrella aquatilis]
MKNSIYLLLICLFLITSCKTEDIIISPKLISNNPLLSATDSAVNRAFLKYQSDLNTVGVSIGLYKNKKSSFYGYGESKLGNGIAPDRNTFFEIGSITKTFTCITAMNMLLEKGQTIDNPIRPYLPIDLPTLARDGVEVNFKHLMTHTSGLSYFPDNFGVGYYTGHIGEEFAKYDRDKLFTWLLNTPLRSKPFTTWEYSNGAMGLLGTLLEINYGKEYGTVLKEKLLVPLQLTDTKTDMNETDMSRWSKGYSNGKEVAYWNSLNAMNGAGVIKSTASDMIKYGLANLNPPNTPLGDAITRTQQVTFLPFTEAGRIKINGRLGWFQCIHKDLPNETFIWHNGGTGGYSSDMFINKAKGSILVVLYNTDKGTQAREDFMLALLKIMSN